MKKNNKEKIEKYLYETALIFDHELNKFNELPQEKCNSINSKILNNMRTEIEVYSQTLKIPESDAIIILLPSTVNGLDIDIYDDHDFSIFGSRNLNERIEICHQLFSKWRNKTSSGKGG